MTQSAAVLPSVGTAGPVLEWEQVACNLCGSDRPEVFHREQLPYFGVSLEFTIVRCRECGLVYTNPRLGDYNATYQAGFCESAEEIEAHASAKQPVFATALRSIKDQQRALGVQSGGRLLDLGSGTGHFLKAAGQAGFESTGVEPAGAPMRYATDVLGMRVHHTDLYRAVLPSDHFDVITAWDVFEHVSDPCRMLHRCMHWLKPGGFLAMRFPSARFQKIKGVLLHMLLRMQRPVFSPTMHLYFFDDHTLRAMCHKVGLELVSARTTPLEYNAAEPWLNLGKRLAGCSLVLAERIVRRPLGNLEVICRRPGSLC